MSSGGARAPAKGGKDGPRREEILAAAARTFAEKGLKGSTTRAIAERASMLSGSLYYYFTSKEAMAVEVVERYLTELLEAYEQVRTSDATPQEQLRELFRTSLQVSDRRPDEVVILYQDWHSLSALDGGMDVAMNRVEEIWCDVIEAGMRSGDLRADLEPRLVYRTIMGALSWVPRWFRPDGPRTISEIAEIQADVIVRGLERP